MTDDSALFADLLSALSPAATFEQVFGVPPCTWQDEFLGTDGDVLVVKGRQIGASTSAAALAIHVARYVPASVTAIISPSLKQSQEVGLKVRYGMRALAAIETLDAENSMEVRLATSGSRILSLPGGNSASVRGYSCALVIVDEGAYVDEETWLAAQALVATTHGRRVVLSTPAGKSGWFYELAASDDPAWTRFRVKTSEVPFVTAEYLDRARRTLGPWAFAMEHEAQFGVGGASLFDESRLLDMVNDYAPPLFAATGGED